MVLQNIPGQNHGALSENLVVSLCIKSGRAMRRKILGSRIGFDLRKGIGDGF